MAVRWFLLLGTMLLLLCAGNPSEADGGQPWVSVGAPEFRETRALKSTIDGKTYQRDYIVRLPIENTSSRKAYQAGVTLRFLDEKGNKVPGGATRRWAKDFQVRAYLGPKSSGVAWTWRDIGRHGPMELPPVAAIKTIGEPTIVEVPREKWAARAVGVVKHSTKDDEDDVDVVFRVSFRHVFGQRSKDATPFNYELIGWDADGWPIARIKRIGTDKHPKTGKPRGKWTEEATIRQPYARASKVATWTVRVGAVRRNRRSAR